MHEFQVSARFEGGVDGRGHLSGDALDTPFSAATGLGGPGEGTNPDELLIAAAASCYLITLGAILRRRELPVRRVALTTSGGISIEGGLRFERIVHEPVLELDPSATAGDREAAVRAAHDAEKACMVSAALRGNLELGVRPTIR